MPRADLLRRGASTLRPRRRNDRQATRSRRRVSGWRIVAAKEFADYLLSVRFYVLLLLVVLASAAAVQAAAGGLEQAAPQATGTPAVFLRLFTASPERIPSVFELVGFLGPLLGIAFGFDSINGERSQGTLPRLVSQPIHRDDVINGKFVGALSLIALTLTLLAAVVTGLGLWRLGITPGGTDLLRLVVYLLVAVAYVGVWLAFAIFCSVAFRRAATSALVAIAGWLVLTIFLPLIVGTLADTITPVPAEQPTSDELLRNARIEQTVSRVSPETLYEESTTAVLDPTVRTLSVLSLEQAQQAQRAVPGTLPLPQSLLVVWPQITALLAGSVVIFALAYVVFMRQEIRA